MAKPKLPGQIQAVIRLQYSSLATEHAYVQWIKRFIIFHKLRHPQEMGAEEIRKFLTYLARAVRGVHDSRSLPVQPKNQVWAK
jgi:hypothetical protein